MRKHPVLVTLAVGWGVAPAVAQEQPIPPQTAFIRAEPAGADLGPNVPIPPRGLLTTPAKHRMPEVPQVDLGMPMPNNPPASLAGVGPAAPCDMNFRRITQTQTGTLATVGEPTVAFAGRTNPNATVGFATGNWYASLSTDAGTSWTAINPYTRFPAIDGGFCCDQTVLYEPERDMTVWYLQYVYSAATQRGSARVAYAIGGQLAANTWSSYVFSPQGFGRPAGEWLDYPDMAVSRDRIFFTSNIFNANGNYTNSIIWTMLLSEFAAGSGTVGWWFTSNLGGGGSIRFTRGAGDTIYGATHANTSSLRILKITNGSLTWFERTHPTWVAGPYTSLAPNGVNWAGRLDSRITGAYQTAKEYGFLWTAAATTGRPQPYTRVSRYRVSDDSHIADDDIWASTFAVMYPSAAANDAGHKCVGVAAGGSFNPGGYAILVDDCNPNFFGQTLVAMAFSNSPPTDAVWGDYTSVLRHPVRTHGFVMTGQGRTTGSTPFNSFAWVTRERDDPATVTVAVRSTPVTGLAIGCTTDTQGRTSVTTDGYATYAQSASYSLTAPASATAGADVYGFRRWIGRSVPYGSLSAFSTTPTVNFNSGLQDDLFEAEYELARKVDIGSRNPTSGVPLSLNVADVQGNQNGTSAFRRHFLPGTSITLTAPAFYNTVNAFKQWWLDGVAQPLGTTTLTINVTAGGAPISAEAEYFTFVAGTVATIGAGCAGSNGQVPLLAATTPNAGTTVNFTTSRVFGPTGAVLYVGASSTTWNGAPLPLQLGFIGMSPTCFLRTSVDLSLSFGIGVGGTGTVPVPLPSTLGVGSQIYWQTAVLDPLVATPTKIIHSNALRTTIGGNL